MLVYFVVMNDYGFKPHTLIFLNQEYGYYPQDTDVYSPNEPNYGNSNWGDDDFHTTLSWGENYETSMDTRLFYTLRDSMNFSKCRWDANDNSVPHFWRFSRFTGKQICYTTDAIFNAQIAYFIGVVVAQWSNVLNCKTRILSLSQ